MGFQTSCCLVELLQLKSAFSKLCVIELPRNLGCFRKRNRKNSHALNTVMHLLVIGDLFLCLFLPLEASVRLHTVTE